MYNKISPILIIIIFLLSYGKVFSSEVTICGNVSDQEGRDIPEAIVRIISESGDIVRTANTNENGNYSIIFDINESGINDVNSVPDNIKLYQNSPNPFRPVTCIPFELSEPGNVQITIFNTLGQKINTLTNGFFSEGYSQVFWNGLNRDGTPLPSGIYIYRLEFQGEVRSGKMLLQEGESSIRIENFNKPIQNSLYKSQKALIEKTYYLEAEKGGYFPTVDSSFTITSEDISFEKNLILEDCSLDSFALYASIDGNPRGLWIFDANNLNKIDSLEMDWVPFYFDISSDNSTWYSTLNTNNIISIDAETKIINKQVNTRNYEIILDPLKEYVITYRGSDYIQFYDAQTLTLTYEDSIGLGTIRKMVASPTENIVYAFISTDQGTKIMVYNTHDHQLEQVIELTDNEVRSTGMAPADLDISPDGNYLFATVFNWSDPNVSGWYGSFHAIDLSTNQVVAEHLCGKYSQMGVSPDGKYVYISDPAGYTYELIPTNQVLCYDVISKDIEVFIDGSIDIGLKPMGDSDYFITDQVVIAPDSRTMFITIAGAVTTADDKDIHMVKIDTKTKKILDYYAIPRDYRGYITSEIKRLRSGKYLP